MFAEGTILYFDPFYFKNGGSKPKYFIVLKEVDEGEMLMATLPTSKDHVPSFAEKEHGCVEVPDAQINAFVFKAGKLITTCDWSFSRTTFIYGSQIDIYKSTTIKEVYPVESIDYEIIGKLTDKVYRALIRCIQNSSIVKRKFKKLL
jgi:hypothetical protein